jgi:Flp pilus assembly protein TadD
LALVLERLGDYDSAITEYETSIEKDPARVAAYNNVGRLLLMRGELQQAKGYVETAHKLDPEDNLVMGNLAGALIASGEINRADDLISAAIATGPENGEVHNKKGIIHQRRQQFKAALDEYELAAVLIPCTILLTIMRLQWLQF